MTIYYRKMLIICMCLMIVTTITARSIERQRPTVINDDPTKFTNKNQLLDYFKQFNDNVLCKDSQVPDGGNGCLEKACLSKQRQFASKLNELFRLIFVKLNVRLKAGQPENQIVVKFLPHFQAERRRCVRQLSTDDKIVCNCPFAVQMYGSESVRLIIELAIRQNDRTTIPKNNVLNTTAYDRFERFYEHAWSKSSPPPDDECRLQQKLVSDIMKNVEIRDPIQLYSMPVIRWSDRNNVTASSVSLDKRGYYDRFDLYDDPNYEKPGPKGWKRILKKVKKVTKAVLIVATIVVIFFPNLWTFTTVLVLAWIAIM